MRSRPEPVSSRGNRGPSGDRNDSHNRSLHHESVDWGKCLSRYGCKRLVKPVADCQGNNDEPCDEKLAGNYCVLPSGRTPGTKGIAHFGSTLIRQGWDALQRIERPPRSQVASHRMLSRNIGLSPIGSPITARTKKDRASLPGPVLQVLRGSSTSSPAQQTWPV
jgi:hypothetical protein